MIFGCDGSHSQVRRESFPPNKYANHRIPVSMFGFTMQVTAAQARPIRELDPFFLQGTASANDVFMYISCKSRLYLTKLYTLETLEASRLTRRQSVLKAPQNSQDGDEFVYQVCISGSTDKEPFRNETSGTDELTDKQRVAVIRTIAESFAEPFRSFLFLISDETKVKSVALDDFAPRKEIFAAGTYTLVGDASHAMAMCESQ
jgi:2-polyprenyl-6-methoxyphenol hydroxylase-like FAD-dependent oxidoreductase